MIKRKDQIIHDQNSDYIPVTQVKRETTDAVPNYSKNYELSRIPKYLT